MSSSDGKICVVSLIGKSQSIKHLNKSWKLNSLIQKNIFKNDPKICEKFLNKLTNAAGATAAESDAKNDSIEDNLSQLFEPNDDGKNGKDEASTTNINRSKPEDHNIQTYFDQKNRVMYVHLESIFDTNNLYEILTKHHALEHKNFFEFWEKEQLKYLKSVLLLFLVSHIIMVSNPSCEMDVSNIRFFRVVDILRNKMLPSLVELLKSLELNISKDWLYAARPCSPRVLFAFENCPQHLLNDPNSKQIIKKFQHSLEDQIYNSLRKSYVITNISNNSLFAIPPNQEFVYVHRAGKEHANINKMLLLSSNFTGQPQNRSNRSVWPYQIGEACVGSTSAESSSDEALFKKFIFEHVSKALTDGFNDNIGRTNVAPVFELPTCDTWTKIFTALMEFLLDEPPKNAKLQSFYSQIKTNIDIDSQFADTLSKKLWIE